MTVAHIDGIVDTERICCIKWVDVGMEKVNSILVTSFLVFSEQA